MSKNEELIHQPMFNGDCCAVDAKLATVVRASDQLLAAIAKDVSGHAPV